MASVRALKYKEFDPEPSKWKNDKRNFDQATESLEVLVAKNFSKLALPCVAIYPQMDVRRGEFLGFRVSAPDGPLKNYFETEDVKHSIYELMKNAVVDALAKKEEKRAGKEVHASAVSINVLKINKLPRPVWCLTLKEIETYFSLLKTAVANWEGIKLKRKWPKIVNGVVEANPTPIPTFEGTVEQILPSSIYIPFEKFSLGNLHRRLKLVCAYLLLKFNQDPNS